MPGLHGKHAVLLSLQFGAVGDFGRIAPVSHFSREIKPCQLNPFLAFLARYCSSYLSAFAPCLPSLLAVSFHITFF